MKKVSVKSIKTIICAYNIALTVFLVFVACCNSSTNENNENIVETTTGYSYQLQMDIAMQNAKSPTVLATVNGIEITNIEMDLFSISNKNYTIDDLIQYYITSDYAAKSGLTMNSFNKDLYDNIETSIINDEILTEEYCQTTYGISQEKVIEYAKNRIYLIGMNSAYCVMVSDDVFSDDFTDKYPELKEAYEKFEKNKLKDPEKAFEDLEQAYYEMIAKDYDVVIY